MTLRYQPSFAVLLSPSLTRGSLFKKDHCRKIEKEAKFMQDRSKKKEAKFMQD
jgi:hypothetical protein